MNADNPWAVITRVQDELRAMDADLGKHIRVADSVRRVSADETGTCAYWYVPVYIDPEATPMYRYYELLSDVEDRIKEEGQERLLLVPIALGASVA